MKQVNTRFTCDLLTTEYDEQLLEAIITLAKYGIHCSCDGLLAMNYLRWQLEIIVASCCMGYHWKASKILRITVFGNLMWYKWIRNKIFSMLKLLLQAMASNSNVQLQLNRK